MGFIRVHSLLPIFRSFTTGIHYDSFPFESGLFKIIQQPDFQACYFQVVHHLSDFMVVGTEREAFYTVDSIGAPFAGGGFNATLRDMGRPGLLILN